MEKTLKRIKSEIKKQDTVRNFSKENDLNIGEMYNFLNGKRNIQFDKLLKILGPLDMAIMKNVPDTLHECSTVILEGQLFKSGESFGDSILKKCFGDESNSVYVLLLEKDGVYILKVIQ